MSACETERRGAGLSERARSLSIGHVARDEFPDGAHRLGGTALYAAATAAHLGVPSALVTRVGPNERAELTRTCAES
ncbi:MAG: hypothetical protein HYU87_00785 [Chloroflexi bacterium]|nr:hypothetical protein [Chloroflexota bacterium]